MILNRLGNKNKIAEKIQKYFPAHDTYVEPFFGAGGMFFNKPKAKYNILNDNDTDVFNLFQVLSCPTKKQELESIFVQMPVCETLMKHWLKNKETEPVRQALRFLLLSNFTYMGKGDTIRYTANNTSQILLDNIEKTHQHMFGCRFMNQDFRKVFKRISYSSDYVKQKTFAYCDPPYLGTTNNYQNGFTPQDSSDLFDCLDASGLKYAMSEFDHPFILEQAEKRKLNVYIIGERRTMKNRQTEILITNYKKYPTLFD